jgi:hypothetical protein
LRLLASAANLRLNAYSPVLTSTHVSATFNGRQTAFQSREANAPRKVLLLKARTKEVAIAAREMGTFFQVEKVS